MFQLFKPKTKNTVIYSYPIKFKLKSDIKLKKPKLFSKSIVLMEYKSGQILYQKNPNKIIPPASLTKLVTLFLIYQKLKTSKVKKSDFIPISKNAWAGKLPRRTSRMFLEPDHRVTIFDIMKGLAIPSGNDAAVAISEYFNGSVESFVDEMNQEMKKLGFKNLKFKDASGLSPENKINAIEFIQFCRIYLQKNPEAIRELHSHKFFTYPRAENLPIQQIGKRNFIKQKNRNSLLGKLKGVDGLKTGYIDKSGFNIALTAKRNDIRLLAVILGARGRTKRRGALNRRKDGMKILNFGFNQYVTLTMKIPLLKKVKIWKGIKNSIHISPLKEVEVSIHKTQIKFLKAFVKMKREVFAPLPNRKSVGELIFKIDQKIIKSFPLYPVNQVPRARFFKRTFDSVKYFISSLF